MSIITCPSCNHTFDPSNASNEKAPDTSVVRWVSTDQSSLGDISTAEAYASYLQGTEGAPVSRSRFVADLAYLGVEEVLDGDTRMLIRD